MDKEQGEKNVRIVVMSDTHDRHASIKPMFLPDADIFIHAGDFTKFSMTEELERFREFLTRLPYKHKIVIAGNHDFALDRQSYEKELKNMKHKHCPLNSEEEIKKLKEVCTYLQHEMVEVQGIKIFGSPFTPKFFDWGFMYPPEDGAKLWSAIPEGVDIVVTHGPPMGILDRTSKGLHAGCEALLKRIEQVKPKVHIFGHIHEAYGKKDINGTTFINASNVDLSYQLVNPEHFIQFPRQPL